MLLSLSGDSTDIGVDAPESLTTLSSIAIMPFSVNFRICCVGWLQKIRESSMYSVREG